MAFTRGHRCDWRVEGCGRCAVVRARWRVLRRRRRLSVACIRSRCAGAVMVVCIGVSLHSLAARRLSRRSNSSGRHGHSRTIRGAGKVRRHAPRAGGHAHARTCAARAARTLTPTRFFWASSEVQLVVRSPTGHPCPAQHRVNVRAHVRPTGLLGAAAAAHAADIISHAVFHAPRGRRRPLVSLPRRGLRRRPRPRRLHTPAPAATQHRRAVDVRRAPPALATRSTGRRRRRAIQDAAAAARRRLAEQRCGALAGEARAAVACCARGTLQRAHVARQPPRRAAPLAGARLRGCAARQGRGSRAVECASAPSATALRLCTPRARQAGGERGAHLMQCAQRVTLALVQRLPRVVVIVPSVAAAPPAAARRADRVCARDGAGGRPRACPRSRERASGAAAVEARAKGRLRAMRAAADSTTCAARRPAGVPAACSADGARAARVLRARLHVAWQAGAALPGRR